MPYLNGATVLDLFAGSGSMGVESISRGAQTAVFVDVDKSAVACINSNIKSCGITDKTVVFHKDALDFLFATDMQFDIIFLDPPYFKDIYSAAINAIYEKNILSKDGIIVVEWDYSVGFENTCSGFDTIKEKKYGRVGITTLKRGIS